jgi:hypothetical protein
LKITGVDDDIRNGADIRYLSRCPGTENATSICRNEHYSHDAKDVKVARVLLKAKDKDSPGVTP